VGWESAVLPLHSVTHPLFLSQQTHAGSAANMEWEDVQFANPCDDSLHRTPGPPESFFDPRLETLESFPKNLLDFSSATAWDSDQFSASLGAAVTGEKGFHDILDNTSFDEALLSDGSLSSILSSDEIFSQIEICSDLLDDSSRDPDHHGDIEDKLCLEDYALSGGDEIVGTEAPPPVKSEEDTTVPSPGDEDVVATCSSQDRLQVKEEKVEPSEDYAQYDINLEKVEYDIAKLKQEVDVFSDDDSLLSDFFSEDDPNEISKEYADFFQHLLTTPVDDFDLALNVFNNVDPDGGSVQDAAAGNEKGEDKYCIDYIRADHSYSLPWEESSSVLLTPPNSSSDDSEPESDASSHISEDAPKLVKSETSKFIQKTVKLKHKKDLKFVFSIKVKDRSQPPVKLSPGRSLLKANQPRAFSSKDPMQRSKESLIRTKENLIRNVLEKRAYKKRHKLNETAMAVQSLLNAENKNIQTDKYLKMQTDREQHNSMERQRRIELKNEFDKLKSLIPDIAHSDKVSKLNVLNYSAEYVKKLERADLKLKLRKSQLKEKRQKLLDDLRKLGSSS